VKSSLVLVVDDERAVRDSWAKGLRYAGFTVYKTGTASEALRLCEEHSFDVVIVDYLIPSMDGIELLTRIRKVLPTARSIVVSGKLDTSADEKAIRTMLHESVEPDRYLHKPISNDELAAAVRDLIGSSSGKSWKEVAEDTVRVQEVRVKDARAASRKLKSIRASRKK